MIYSIFSLLLLSIAPPDSFVYPLKVDTSQALELTIFPPKGTQPPLRYRIDWGDGDSMDWGEPGFFQWEIYRTHQYQKPGVYIIRVMVGDGSGAVSEWSKPCSVTVVPSLLKWFSPTLEPVVASPALDNNGNVYVGDESGTLYSFSPAGELRWSFSARGAIYAGATVDAGLVYVPALDSWLYCLDTLGNLKWSVKIGDELWTPVAIGKDRNIYLVTDQGRLVSVDPKGRVRWQVKLGDEASSAPTIGPDGNLYVSADSVYSFTPRGKRRWAFGTPEGSYFFAAPVVDHNRLVYVGNFDGNLYCLGPDGRMRWRSPVPEGDEVRTEAVFAPDSHVYLGTDGDYLCAYDFTAGRWQVVYEAGDVICATPAVSEKGAVYVVSDDGVLYALTSAGRLFFSYQIAVEEKELYFTSAPTIGPDGTVYVGSWDGGIYALEGDAPPANTLWPQFRVNAQHTGRIKAGKGR